MNVVDSFVLGLIVGMVLVILLGAVAYGGR